MDHLANADSRVNALIGWDEAKFTGTKFGEYLGANPRIQSQLHIVAGVKILHKQITECANVPARELLGGSANILYIHDAMSARLIDVQVPQALHCRCETLNGERRLNIDFICHIDVWLIVGGD